MCMLLGLKFVIKCYILTLASRVKVMELGLVQNNAALKR